MITATVGKLRREVEARYARRRPRSREAHARACMALAGGDTRSATNYPPFPTYMARGAGCWLTDVDGLRYLDLLNNYTSMILGHAHPAVTAAAAGQLRGGTALGAPSLLQAELAELIQDRVPTVERLRFANSGTEAAMQAVRAARVYTGRRLVIKMEGGYHGSADGLEGSVNRVGPQDKDEVQRPAPENPGITAGFLADLVVVPFNSPEALAEAFGRWPSEVAAVVIEPMMGSAGAIPPLPGYLEEVARLCRRHGTVLIFDEVQTFRLARGGAQEYFRVSADLTILGKVIGGGFPVGAFGGRADIMSVYAPGHPTAVSHSGTFNGNPMTMAAGIATLSLLTREAISELNRRAATLTEEFRLAFRRQGVAVQITGIGSIFHIHFASMPVCDFRSAQAGHSELSSLLHLLLMERGLYLAKRCMYNLSTPVQAAQIALASARMEEAVAALKPAVAEVAPELLGPKGTAQPAT